MADGKSKDTTSSIDDVERIYEAFDRQLARMRATLDDLRKAGETTVKVQGDGQEAVTQLQTFVRGLESSE